MNQPFGFCWQLWRNNSHRLYLFACVYVGALLTLWLTPRTVLGEGYLPRAGWQWVLMIWLLLPLLVMNNRSPIHAHETKWAVLAIIGLIWSPTLSIKIGLLLLTVAGVLAWSSWRGAQELAIRYLEMAGLWIGLMFGINIYNHIAARLDGIPWIGYGIAPLLTLLGLPNWVQGNQVFVHYEGFTYPMLLSLDKFGGAFPWLLGIGILVSGYQRRIPVPLLVSALLWIGFTSIAYALFITTEWVVQGNQLLWWDETLLGGFYGLATIPVAWLLPASPVPNPSTLKLTSRQSHACTVALILAIFLIVTGWLWVDPGVRKAGTILIDEYYSDWEWSDVTLNTQRYGVQTVYNYYCMVEFFKHYFAQVERNNEPLSYERLRSYSVVILKTPTQPYPPSVREALRRYVEEGGSLWLIGDHTNIFGMNNYLNTVLAPWKLRLEADAVIDPETNRQLYAPTAIAHPVVRSLPVFLFYTGCSVQAPLDWGTYEVILSPRMLRDKPDLAQNTFFGDFAPSLAESVCPTIQAVVKYAGKGRVGIWSDSTLFSNFAITLPGKMELAVGFLDFLNRQNRFPQLRLMSVGAGCLLALIGFRGLRTAHHLAIVAVWSGILAGTVFTTFCYSQFYPALQLHTPFEKIGFLEAEPTDHLPILRPIDDPYPNSYLTAFVAALRAGKYAETCFKMSQVMSYPRVVVIHGHQVIDWKTLSDFVHAGRKLILLDGGATPEALVQASQVFGIRYVPMPGKTVLNLQDASIPVEIAGYFQSGIPLLVDSERRALLIAHQFGQGKVYLSTTEALFSDMSLGEPSDIPNAAQFALLTILFQLYGD
ncbi:hypothetical protein HRbin15_02204 [bacterium HR15]|nr:hypothetical protein HRbin15_02204 [bacterium HR15]